MPERETTKRARQDLREGKSASTAAGEFVKEEIEHVRKGKHGARSPQQAIAIGLSKARRAGVPLPPPKKNRSTEGARKSAERENKAGQSGHKSTPSARASHVREEVLKKESHASASHHALSKHAHTASRERTSRERHESAMKAVHTKGRKGLHEAARKAARTKGKSGLHEEAKKAADTRARRKAA